VSVIYTELTIWALWNWKQPMAIVNLSQARGFLNVSMLLCVALSPAGGVTSQWAQPASRGPFHFSGYFTTLSLHTLNTIDRQGNSLKMIGEVLQAKQSWLHRGIIFAFDWRDWWKPWKTLVRLAGVQAEIVTEQFLNTSVAWYRCASPLSNPSTTISQ
jgi:hypothetical protein